MVRCRNKEFLDPEWVDPHDWTTAKDSIQNCGSQSTESKPCEHSVKSEYFRLVNSLFNPSEFQVRVIVVENVLNVLKHSYPFKCIEINEMLTSTSSLMNQQIICIVLFIFISQKSN